MRTHPFTRILFIDAGCENYEVEGLHALRNVEVSRWLVFASGHFEHGHADHLRFTHGSKRNRDPSIPTHVPGARNENRA